MHGLIMEGSPYLNSLRSYFHDCQEKLFSYGRCHVLVYVEQIGHACHFDVHH